MNNTLCIKSMVYVPVLQAIIWHHQTNVSHAPVSIHAVQCAQVLQLVRNAYQVIILQAALLAQLVVLFYQIVTAVPLMA